MNDSADGPPVEPQEPYIPAEVNLAEITVKAVILGIVLSVLLAGANAYLGLKAGMTVSASIPAAVISMAVLRMFRRSNILENNIVQTAASAGESLAAGVIFTLPALVLLGEWTDFNYLETTIIAGLGGLLGVLFTIPLRRALIVETPLTFPEGVATAEVLKVGDQGGAGIGAIVAGATIGVLFKFGETGLKLWAGVIGVRGHERRPGPGGGGLHRRDQHRRACFSGRCPELVRRDSPGGGEPRVARARRAPVHLHD
jgi:OPT family oligopeptide transporter